MIVFKYDKVIKVKELSIKWDLYWTMADHDEATYDELAYVNKALTLAAWNALEQRDPKIWEAKSEEFVDYGAADTEPRWQFSSLWYEAYGEDI